MKGWGITIGPAYDRDYKTEEEAIAAWNEGKDFKIHTPCYPTYINRADAENYGAPDNTVKIRYSGLAEFVFLHWNGKEWEKQEDEEEKDANE